MKKLKSRAFICLFFAVILVIGLIIYTGLLAVNGSDWASYPANTHIYNKGRLKTGTILDRNGVVLFENTDGGAAKFNDDYYTRKAMVHATGDAYGNIATGANKAFASQLIGYNFVTGTYSMSGQGRKLTMTLDSEACTTANEALDGRSGTVGVYNYETGEILCMVSSPNYDPLDPPENDPDDKSGAFLNRLLSSKVVPGSIFKLITSTAAIEKVSDIEDFSYTCTGSHQLGTGENDRITCPYPHGTVDFEEALAVSCNCAFGEITRSVGPENMEKYTEKAGLENSYNIDGINTIPGSFTFPSNDVNLSWAGIGQYKDLVNPCSMMVYMGAIANGGKGANPRLIKSLTFTNGFPSSFKFKTETNELINSDTATKLKSMMANNVTETYGQENFPGLNICAKSGTAETSKDQTPNSWFTGFLDDEDHPYAFIVLVEKGGSGSAVAGKVANSVLQELVSE